MKTFLDLSATGIDGKEISMSTYKGKKILVVNTASKCGFTPQYKDLERLYREFGPEKFVILGFPANNFLWQEPKTNDEIASFCSLNYDVTFPMFAKISVKGSKQHPVYEWLTKKELNGKADARVKWNFQKFMISENGEWLDMVPPAESPYCEKIVNWLRKG
ncbi:MAG TPA: glutathione peroxidase [Bacteroidales bacterium]|nr:glutathione peroxidase [Bacteroidales bacterium]HNZ43235.1 glutathione peroxidase [Bacteroidales bacterium]HOH83149.1 glutathione peroxidase [Bacteroidales bacterium]HPB25947.1 glutathione peroxidase [Bacteroidales bacterium]HPI30765.1 glutathione peroxidase [Bacteroidales bacterium]